MAEHSVTGPPPQGAAAARPAVKLPSAIRACLFDLDGVLTDTASVHDSAWKEVFDEYLASRAARDGNPFEPFDPVDDYDRYVDGLPREDGTRAFLASRDITLPEGNPDDPADAETVAGLGNKKNVLLLAKIASGGVHVYPGSMTFVEAVRRAGLSCAVVSSSTNARRVLDAAGYTPLLDGVVDGNVAKDEGLEGKPAPDTYLAGARMLGVTPAQAAVFEDALAGVEAGRAGNFGYVVGVDRVHQADDLRRRGASIVVEDLAELIEVSPA